MFKQTKKALLLSVLMLVVCLSMLIGTTYAWFTDSASSDANIIQAGNLDVKMEWAVGTANPADETSWNATEGTAIFNNTKWEPGYAEARHIKISNIGSLALKYQVVFEVKGEDYFRKIEKEYYKEYAKKNGLIISTGGGIVKNIESIDRLKENGMVIFVDRKIEKMILNF